MSEFTGFVRRSLIPVVLAVTFGMPVGVWLLSTGNIAWYFTLIVPPGQTLFVLSKLFALLAIVMCWFQLLSALAKETPALRGFPRLSGRRHIYFGAATYAAVLTHVVLFITASTLRTKHAALDLLLPTFSHGFYRAMVSVGATALWLLAAGVLAGWRRRRGDARFKWVHRLVFGVFALAFLHGITIGSETRYGLMTYVYAFMGLSLGTAVLSRAWSLTRQHRGRSPVIEARIEAPGADHGNAQHR